MGRTIGFIRGPRWSYQIGFAPAQFSEVVSWLALNHEALDVFVHPNTDNELRDHRDCTLWLGEVISWICGPSVAERRSWAIRRAPLGHLIPWLPMGY